MERTSPSGGAHRVDSIRTWCASRWPPLSTLHSVRRMACASTRWTAPRCGDARHPPRHALPLRTVTVRGAPGGRSLPSRTGHQGHGVGRLRGGSGMCQGETSKITRKLVAGQGLLSTGWAGWNPCGTPGQGGCIECTAPDAPSPSVHASGGAGGSGGHSDARRWSVRCGARCGGCGAPVRWCGGWECTASSAGAPVRPMHRTTAPDAGMLRTPPPGGTHRVDRATVVSTPLRARARGGVHRVHSSPATAPRGAPRVRPATGVLPGAGASPGGWRRRR